MEEEEQELGSDDGEEVEVEGREFWKLVGM